MPPESTTQFADWLLARAGGCPRGARHRLWLVMLLAAVVASQFAFAVVEPVLGHGLIPLVVGVSLAITADVLLFTRVLIPLEHEIVAAHALLVPAPVALAPAPVDVTQLAPSPAPAG
jgi:hypothetical protein